MGTVYINSETGEKIKVACVIDADEADRRFVFKIKSGNRPLRDPWGYYRRARWDTFAEAQAELDELAENMGWEKFADTDRARDDLLFRAQVRRL